MQRKLPPVLRALAAVAVLTAFAACTSAPPPAPPPRLPAAVEPYLLDPLSGYPLTADRALVEAVAGGHRQLRATADPAAAEAVAQGVLEQDPGFHPAIVLHAQAAAVGDRPQAAVELLQPIADELPGYLAAQLLLGWASEALDDVVGAYQAYQRIEGIDRRAAERAERLRPRALEVVVNRIDQALIQGRVEQAEALHDDLVAWQPEGQPTAETAWWIAVARQDAVAEHAALEQLLRLDDSRRDVLERLAQLEVEAGRLQAGISRLETLAARFPDDPAIVESLERAKFRWRLQLLPRPVQALAAAAELDRADLAVLIYWLIPEVRHAELTNPPIATDILDHQRRDEIVRVLNLDLMRIDETLHRFAPERPASRVQVLTALLTLLRRAGPPLACLERLGGVDLGAAPTLVCTTAARCGLLAEEADCLPSAAVSGPEALELLRRTLDLFGS